MIELLLLLVLHLIFLSVVLLLSHHDWRHLAEALELRRHSLQLDRLDHLILIASVGIGLEVGLGLLLLIDWLRGLHLRLMIHLGGKRLGTIVLSLLR